MEDSSQPYRDNNFAAQLAIHPNYKIDRRHIIDGNLIFLKDIDGCGIESPEISFAQIHNKQEKRTILYWGRQSF